MFETTAVGATNWLENHPRALGALFALTLLLSQATSAMAGISGATAGP